jgi:hypothetical protein
MNRVLKFIAERSLRLLYTVGGTSCVSDWPAMSSSVPVKGRWEKPEGKPPGKLRVYNSLTRSKVSVIEEVTKMTDCQQCIGGVCSLEWP